MQISEQKSKPNLYKGKINGNIAENKYKNMNVDDLPSIPMNINLQMIDQHDPILSYQSDHRKQSDDAISDFQCSEKNDSNPLTNGS